MILGTVQQPPETDVRQCHHIFLVELIAYAAPMAARFPPKAMLSLIPPSSPQLSPFVFYNFSMSCCLMIWLHTMYVFFM